MNRSTERTEVPTSNDNGYDRRRGPRDRGLRVGDRERDAVSEILRERHLEGRLDNDEFQSRLERCLAAKTYVELDDLIADFPADDTGGRRVGRERVWRPSPFLFLPLALIAAIVLSHGHLAWLLFPLAFFFVLRTFVWRSWGGGYRGGPWACGPRRFTRV
jgi:hypothetical protein